MKPPEIDIYRSKFASYSAYATRLQDLVTQLVERSSIRMHFVESRAKSPDSFSEKLRRPGKRYNNPFEEMPDLVGLRIVLYYTDSVQLIGSLLKQEFQILEEEAGHQASAYDTDQFGYLSMHYVVRLHDKRKNLPEWHEWRDVRAEIQVRTVLQHSWAAVSHALQYKREGDVPVGLRRRLHRLAGLFELADEEFVGIRNEAASISMITKAELKKDPNAVVLDAQSLSHFLSESPEFKRLHKEAEQLGFMFGSPTFESDYDDDAKDDEKTLGIVVEQCHLLGIGLVRDLKHTLKFDAKPYLKAVMDGEWWISDAFLVLLLLIKAHPEAFSVSKLTAEGWATSVAEKVIKVASETTKT